MSSLVLGSGRTYRSLCRQIDYLRVEPPPPSGDNRRRDQCKRGCLWRHSQGCELTVQYAAYPGAFLLLAREFRTRSFLSEKEIASRPEMDRGKGE
jgi:hypothetical protein